MAYMPKTVVDYRKIPEGEPKRCGTCIMFRSPDSCTLVMGTIEPDEHTCSEWESKQNGKR